MVREACEIILFNKARNVDYVNNFVDQSCFVLFRIKRVHVNCLSRGNTAFICNKTQYGSMMYYH